ncbi:hypothetical protein GOBAR_AA00351 [Gossypium barbadense]|uniref:DUF4283 domain-containing protein n=1 Tax=Gossypium barbadense TaxID=3634 RepID=A0A2P5YXA6_GOSBA|nr:hypothetical protein GOBAR_AA00351 [Gossypium barbadense]
MLNGNTDERILFCSKYRLILTISTCIVIEDELANLSILDEEEEAFQEEAVVIEQSFQFSLVGRCLTDSVVNFPALRNTMADLWHPIRGICITDLGNKCYIFQLFNEVDVQKVMADTPWFFNRLMSEPMARQFGDCLGKFLDYDTSIPFSGNKNYMRIRVHLDVTAPLKRKKKIQIGKDFGDKLSNPNLIPLGSNQQFSIKGNNNGSSLGKGISFVDGLENGLMEMVVDEENDPLTAVEGKKRQRLMTGPNVTLGFNVECGALDLTANSGEVWRLMGFYGNPDGRLRGTSWELLRQLGSDPSSPWVVLGDFNKIINSYEKRGGRLRSKR